MTFWTDISVYPNGIGRSFMLISDRVELAQALLKRLETPSGWLARFMDPNSAAYADYQNYGYDISNLLNQKFTPAKVLAMETGIKIECEKDSRVFSTDVLVNVTITQSVLTIQITVTPKDPRYGGPFKFIIGPTDQLSLILLTQPTSTN